MASIVPDTMSGTRCPTSRIAASMPRRPALTFRVSCWVSRMKEIRSALEEPGRLLLEVADQRLEGDAAGDRDRLRGRAHRAGDEPRAIPGLGLGHRLAGELGGDPVQLAGALGKAILGEDERRAAEGIGLDDVGPDREVPPVDVEDDVGPGDDQILIAPVEIRAAEVGGREVPGLDGGAHGAVEDQDPLPKELLEQSGALTLGSRRDWVHARSFFRFRLRVAMALPPSARRFAARRAST